MSKTSLLKKAFAVLFCAVLSTAAFAEEKSMEFLLGGGASAAGPEVSFTFRVPHWEVETSGAVMWPSYSPIGSVFLFKGNTGYVFNELPKSKLKFSTGGNVCWGYQGEGKESLFVVGAYGKVARCFGEHFELSLETYIPFYNNLCDPYTFDLFLACIPAGLMCSAVYAKYRF